MEPSHRVSSAVSCALCTCISFDCPLGVVGPSPLLSALLSADIGEWLLLGGWAEQQSVRASAESEGRHNDTRCSSATRSQQCETRSDAQSGANGAEAAMHSHANGGRYLAVQAPLKLMLRSADIGVATPPKSALRSSSTRMHRAQPRRKVGV